MSKSKKHLSAYKEVYVFYAHSIPFHGHTINHAPLGGSESAVVYMARSLQQLGKKVIVFTATDEPGVYDGVEYRAVATFMQYVQRTIIDVFIAVRDVAIFDLPIHARLKMLWVHDAHDQPHVQGLSNPDVLKKIDRIITVSHWQKKQYANSFNIPDDQFYVSRNGIHKGFFRKYTKKRKKQLVYTSTPFRGLDLLLDCFPTIRQHVPDAELAVFSSMKVYGMADGEDKERFGHIYEKCLQPGVTLYGSIRQADLAKKLSQSRLFVYPNHFPETSCIAALEAQAAGLPCVVSDLGALRETVQHGETGVLVSGDVASAEFRQQFIKTVVGYLNDEDAWQEHSRRAHETVCHQHTWDVVAQEWVASFDASRPTLSLCMIVRNEESHMKDCLSAVHDFVDEVVLVDTGSEDDTVLIAQDFEKVKVYQYKWNDDFSRPRNFSLTKATKEWILVLDADERIAAQDLVHIRRILNVRESIAYKLLQRSYTNDNSVAGWKANTTNYAEGKGYEGFHDSYLVRLFRNKCGFKFEGRVHETVEASILRKNMMPTNTDIPIHHYGKIGVQSEVEKGRAYLSLGKHKVSDKSDAVSLRELGIQCAELGMDADARSYFEQARKENPKDVVVLSNLAVLYIKEERIVDAVALLEEAIAVNQRYQPAYINAALAYKKLGRYAEAKALLERVVKLDEKQPLVWKELGVLEVLQKRYAKACEYFKRVKKLSATDYMCDESAYALYKLGCVLLKNNDIKQAITYFDEAISIKKVFPVAMIERGVAYVRSGNIAAARDQFEAVIAACKMDEAYRKQVVNAYVNLGYIENYESNFSQAIVFLRRAIELDHHDAEALNHLGIAMCGLGNLEEAVRYFESALHENPHHHSAKVNLHRVKELFVQETNVQARQ